ALNDARRVARSLAARECHAQRSLEVLRDALEVALCRRTDEPHEQEERHHRRHEVGISDLPGTGVMSARDLLDPLDDDWRTRFVVHAALLLRLRGHAFRGAFDVLLELGEPRTLRRVKNLAAKL